MRGGRHPATTANTEGGRVALVVGNRTYAHSGRLPNPENDAAFQVTTELDADRVELTEALRAFTRRSPGADVSLVFYAGHGIEMNGCSVLLQRTSAPR